MKFKLLVLIILTAFLFPACRTATDPQTNDAAKHLRVATPFKIQHLDPTKSGHYFLVEFGAAELPLILDADGKIKPWLAESYEQLDKFNWRLRLRPNVKFQSGKPLTAEAFARAMNRQIERSPETKTAVGEASARASGENEVILTTVLANPSIPAALADENVFPIYDAETVEAAGADSLKLAGGGVYTGVYQITAVSEQSMSMERNAFYRRGEPPFERVSVLFVADPQARVLAVQTGEADLALYPQTQNKRQLEGRTDAFFKLSGKTSGGPSIFLNVRIAPFDDGRVRRAASLGLNYESLATETMDGIYLPADGFYPPSISWAKKNQQTDVEQAKKLLDDAGWLPGESGVREKSGEKLAATLLTYPQQADFAALAVGIQAQLRQIGFEIKIRQVDDIQSELKNQRTWNFAFLGSGTLSTGGAPDPVLQRHFLSDAEENRFGIADARLDEKIRTLAQSFDEAERTKLLHEIQDMIIAEQAYLIRAGFARARAIVGGRFKNYEPSPQLQHITFETKPD